MRQLKKIKLGRGFTLIELIVALAIFVIIIGVTIGIFSSILKAQRKAYNVQITQDIARYLMEMMTKEIRMAKVNSVAPQVLTIERLDSLGNPVTYTFFNDNNPVETLRRQIVTGGQAEQRDINDASKVAIRGYFYGDTNRVTIVIEAKSKGSQPTEQAVIRLQSSVNSRYYGP